MFTPEQRQQLLKCLKRIGFSNDHEMIQALTNNQNVDLNRGDTNNFTPLRIAIQKQDKEAIKLLYSLEPNPKYLSSYDQAMLDEVILGHKGAIKKLSVPEHREFIFCIQAFYSMDPLLVDEGVCSAISHMRRQAVFAGETEVFRNRLKNIHYNLWPIIQKVMAEVEAEGFVRSKKENLSLFFRRVKAKLNNKFPYNIWYDLYAFFDGLVCVQTDLSGFPELLDPEKEIMHSPVESLIYPVKLDSKGMGLPSKHVFSGNYTETTLLTYFECLGDKLKNFTDPVSFEMDAGHSFIIDYFKGKWVYTDSNHLEEGEKECDNKEITQLLLKYYPQPCVFATKPFITSDVEELFNQSMDALKKDPKWIGLHEKISKEQSMQKNSFGHELFYIAAGSGDVNMVKQCINVGAECTLRPKNLGVEGGAEYTPLSMAAGRNHLEVVKEVIKTVNDEKLINHPIHGGWTPLSSAITGGRLDVARELLQKLNDEKIINYPRQDGWTPLSLASRYGHLDIVKELLQKLNDEKLINHPTKNGDTPLSLAVKHGHLEIVKELLKKLNDEKVIHYSELWGKTALEVAAENGHIEIVKEFLKKSKGEEEGIVKHVLSIAVKRGHTELVKELFKMVKENDALSVAAKCGSTEVVKQLLEKVDEKEITTPNKNGKTPLYVAAQQGHTGVVKQFLEKLNDEKIINQPTENGETPLYVAAKKGHTEVVKQFLEKLNDEKVINQPTENGETPLYIAVQQGHTGVVKQFLEKLNDEKIINQPTENGETPLYVAAKKGHTEVVKQFLEKLNDEKVIYKPNEHGETPLFTAVKGGHTEIVKELLKKLKDKSLVNQATKNGTTLLLAAIERGDRKIVEELLKSGADVEKPGNIQTFRLLELTKDQNCEDALRQLFIQEKIGKTFQGFTPLHAAILLNKPAIIEWLLRKNGAKLEPSMEGTSVYRLAVVMGLIDLLPPDLQHYNKLEHSIKLIKPFLQDYQKIRNKRFQIKDKLSPEDKKIRKKFIEYLSNERNFMDSGINGLLKAIEKGITQFPGVYFQTILHRCTLELMEKTPTDEEFSNTVKAMHEFGNELTQSESQAVTTLTTQLKRDLDYFISQNPKKPPNEHDFNQFKTKFNARLHSQDVLMSQQENWASFALNLFLAVITVGIALGIKAAHSKLTTGQVTLFSRETEKEKARDELQKVLDKAHESIGKPSV
jgi:ankyrin repeat protein